MIPSSTFYLLNLYNIYLFFLFSYRCNNSSLLLIILSDSFPARNVYLVRRLFFLYNLLYQKKTKLVRKLNGFCSFCALTLRSCIYFWLFSGQKCMFGAQDAFALISLSLSGRSPGSFLCWFPYYINKESVRKFPYYILYTCMYLKLHGISEPQGRLYLH